LDKNAACLVLISIPSPVSQLLLTHWWLNKRRYWNYFIGADLSTITVHETRRIPTLNSWMLNKNVLPFHISGCYLHNHYVENSSSWETTISVAGQKISRIYLGNEMSLPSLSGSVIGLYPDLDKFKPNLPSYFVQTYFKIMSPFTPKSFLFPFSFRFAQS